MTYHWLRFVWQGPAEVLRVLQERAAGWSFACERNDAILDSRFFVLPVIWDTNGCHADC